jgi:hypothetical protein
MLRDVIPNILSGIMLSDITLDVNLSLVVTKQDAEWYAIILSVVMLNVIMLLVAAQKSAPLIIKCL